MTNNDYFVNNVVACVCVLQVLRKFQVLVLHFKMGKKGAYKNYLWGLRVSNYWAIIASVINTAML